MAESSSSSFIPKQSGAPRRRQPTQRNNLFLVTIISYSIFIAAPIASAVVFIYDKYTEKQYAQAIIDLDAAVKSFSVAEMERITEFNDRLKIANELLDSHVSFVSLFNILENSSAVTVQFNGVEVDRTDRNTLAVVADLTTDSFDALLFQRGVYGNEPKVAASTFTGLTFNSPVTPESGTSRPSSAQVAPAEDSKLLTLKSELVFAADSIAYTPMAVFENTTPPEAAVEVDEESDVTNQTGS